MRRLRRLTNIPSDMTASTTPWIKVGGAALLVAGTAVGAGMIGLPVATAEAGFFATTIGFLLCWVVMLLSAYCMLEVSLAHKGETNLISMARSTLGPLGANGAWIVYLFFMYAVMAAYTAGGGAITAEALNLPPKWATTGFVIVFAICIILGARAVDYANRFFMAGLIAAFIGLLWMIQPAVSAPLLAEGSQHYIWTAVPMMITAFGFHLLIPSLTHYLNHDVKALRLSIFLGSLIPLVVYLIWEAFILGSLPLETLRTVKISGDAVTGITHALSGQLATQQLGSVARIFTFFALVSSFVGVALGLFDFLSDGLKVKKKGANQCLLALLTFAPPAGFALFYPAGFLVAISYAGVLGSILLILYPALMVRQLRQRHPKGVYQLPIGQWVLNVLILIALTVVCLHFATRFGYLPGA